MKVLHFTLCLVCIFSVAGCASLPPLNERSLSQALSPEKAANTTIGRAIAAEQNERNDHSGIIPLADAWDAFAARILLAEEAEKTLDVQYYIWRADDTGLLLFSSLYEAAERGVRVRLLLDDLNTTALEGYLQYAHNHPNFEVRLFNPFVYRRSRILGFITDFDRANRRMHNKSFTADNVATIVGGRNVGDAYFGAGEGMLFNDLDVLAVGPVVREVSADFDLFWHSASSYPLHQIIDTTSPRSRYQPQPVSLILHEQAELLAYMTEVMDTAFIGSVLAGEVAFDWVDITMVSDDPSKGLGDATGEQLISNQLAKILGEPSSYLELVSPYFVPTRAGTEALINMAKRGVEITILTNSLEATDVAMVHAGYAKWRKPLLKAGIRIFEMRKIQPEGELANDDNRLARFGSGAGSLHAKTFAVDGERVFVGSFNFDPRSVALNTELGFVIDSPDIAQVIDETFKERMPQQAYELKISASGRLYWIERSPGRVQRHDIEPGTSWLQRSSAWFFSLLPIDWLL
ncbi:phosphatidylserine/phosphatidylglycerophosphate/cardiolipin synthase [Idiomarina sp. A28L]|uniref:phospholipase D family protein n=1 Tax=Idiomarina sp. A28L TaxID=1036674 RepID=UPI0002138AA9|nr:phospholipase D family protein [Idiomarina sp. A28L]EGN75032.1 phosphatidylserine/phosphatidylglycerophosphate/cardiolipin synthase [Idiomarina sp. A28L]